MKLTIFGATGRTGVPLVEQALIAGHDIVALARTPGKMPVQHERLALVQGDVLDAAKVARVIRPETEAVICTLSPVKDSPNDLLPRAVQHILSAMHTHGVKRLIYMTGAGVDVPGDEPKLINHAIKFALKTLSGDILNQSERAVEMIRSSDRDWTIIRAPMLTNGPHTGDICIGMVGINTGPRLARADAADFILRQLADDAYVHAAPVISN